MKKKVNTPPVWDPNHVELNPLITLLRKYPIANNVSYGFFENSEGIKLFYRFWQHPIPMKKNSTLTIFFHGLAGHTEYWQLLADRIIEHTDLIGFDLRGHGFSGGKRGDIETFDVFINDCKETVDWILNKREESRTYTKVFLLGESMGTIVLGASLIQDLLKVPELHKINGIIFFAPAFAPNVTKLPIKAIFTNIWYILLYPFNKGATRIYQRGNEEAGANDPIHQQYDRTDPVHLDYLSLRFLLKMKQTMDKIKKRGAIDITTPLLMIYGQNDIVLNHQASVDYANHCQNKDVTIYEIPGGKHALFTDPNFEPYWSKLIEWINQK